jgi:hypothetical protein
MRDRAGAIALIAVMVVIALGLGAVLLSALI